MKQIIDSSNRSDVVQKRQLYVVKELNKRFATENAIIIQEDKGKTIVIIYPKGYSEKVHSFSIPNNFSNLTKGPTENYKN